jgi:putative alpha-1,2-mannosidase
MTKLDPKAFLDPEIGATASAILFKQRVRQYSSPFDAATGYAGCQVSSGKCANFVLCRLKWWWDNGLANALAKMETTKIAMQSDPGNITAALP